MATDRNAKIEINIVGESIRLTVPFDQQEAVRECEKEINSLYAEWRHEFPRKSTGEPLAMIAYRYASLYKAMSRKLSSLATGLDSTASLLDSLTEEPDDADGDTEL